MGATVSPLVKKTMTALVVVLALSSMPRLAQATSVEFLGGNFAVSFLTSVGNPGCLGGPTGFKQDTVPVTHSQECAGDSGSGGKGASSAAGSANAGKLSTSLLVSLSGGIAYTGLAGASWVASYVVGGRTEPVTTSYFIDVDGTLQTSPCLARHCVASASIRDNDSFGWRRDYLVTDGEDLVIDEQVTSGRFTVIPGIPFAVGFRFDSFASMVSGVGASTVNFQNTVSFIEDGPVFDLPPGYTVNGPCIEDNRYVCGAAAPAQPVPASPSVLLFGAGLVWVVVRRLT